MSPVEKSVLEALSKGIQAELAAYVFYKKGMGVTNSDRLREILGQLAGEEKKHYKALEGQYDNLVRSEMWISYNDVMKQEGLPDIDEKMESVHEDLSDKIDEHSTPLEILEIALFLEKRARDLYTELAEKTTDPSGKETYGYLVKFETGHVKKIEALMKEF
ncbi:MAG: ferritin family protein [candidate division Zixibacteria bacterium]|nr:ferritin family protein [candidate division Zixibacteria bacterium]